MNRQRVERVIQAGADRVVAAWALAMFVTGMATSLGLGLWLCVKIWGAVFDG